MTDHGLNGMTQYMDAFSAETATFLPAQPEEQNCIISYNLKNILVIEVSWNTIFHRAFQELSIPTPLRGPRNLAVQG